MVAFWLAMVQEACFKKKMVKGCWGFVARDSDGDVCGSGGGRLEHVQDALHAEAEACIQALSFAHQSGIVKIQVETDAQLLVQEVNSNEQDLAPNGVLFVDIKTLGF
jgi:ribonuclease HI